MRRTRIGHWVALLLLVGCARAAEAPASFAGPNGPLYLTSGDDVWALSFDGSAPSNLTSGPGAPGSGADPSASAASGPVAYVVGSGAAAEIWTMNPDGSGQRQITSNAVADSMPAISADGTRIVFVSKRGATGADVWTMNADGSSAAPLFEGSGDQADPQFSPDERYVVFTTPAGGDLDLAFVPATGGPHPAATDITHHALDEGQAALQPDQVRLAYVRAGDIFTAYYNGTDEFPLAVDPALDERSPTFSPDGRSVAYAAGSQVYVAAAGGLSPAPLVLPGIADPDDLDWAVGRELDADAPQTTITKAPKRRTRRTTARVRFESSEAGSSFKCALDRRELHPCESPQRLRRLDSGRHRFRVVATDAAGNADPSPAKARFRVLET